jgi:hypothetical protein
MALAWQQVTFAIRTVMGQKSPGPSVARSIDVEVTDEDDFSNGRYRTTVSVDLDDLSDPVD